MSRISRVARAVWRCGRRSDASVLPSARPERPEPGYFVKLLGDPLEKPPAYPSVSHIAISAITTFAGLGSFATLGLFAPPSLELAVQLLPSFGSSAVVLFGYPSIPFSQPRHVIGGHFISAASGLLVAEAITWAAVSGPAAGALAAPASVSLALVAMMLSNTMHPPAGGTAMIAAGLGSGSAGVGSVGVTFLLTPILSGSVTLVAIAALVNNLVRGRRYPAYW